MPSQSTYKTNTFSSQNCPKNTPIFHPDSSGKEKDVETGYHYFGARYYNSDLSLWLSVDPMSDKYPSLSPYNYCAWNPLKWIDPNGEEKIISFVRNSTNQEFNRRNSNIINAANRYMENNTVIHLWAHGDPNSITASSSDGTPLSISNSIQMSDFLKENSTIYQNNAKSGETSILVLHSCETGKGEDNIAQKISKDLNLLVVAPSEKVVINAVNPMDTDTPYYEHGVNKVSRDANGHPSEIGARGSWNVFYKGTKVDSFDGHTKPIFKDAKKTIEKYEKIYQKQVIPQE